MYLKLNERGNIVGFSSRPARGFIGVERELYNRARTKYTSVQMQRRKAPIEIEPEPEDIAESMALVRAKNFDLFLSIVGEASGIKPEHVHYGPDSDAAREAFSQIYFRDYVKKDPIGCALAWSNGKLYNPAMSFVKPEPKVEEPEKETQTEQESNGTGSNGPSPEPEQKGKTQRKKRPAKTRKTKRTTKAKDSVPEGSKPSGKESGDAPNESEGVQKERPLSDDPWDDVAKDAEG